MDLLRVIVHFLNIKEIAKNQKINLNIFREILFITIRLLFFKQ